MVDLTPFLPGLSPVQGKAVVARFDGGRLSSEGGLLALREIERRLGLSDRLASCLVDPRAPEKVVHRLAEIIRFRMLMIAAGYEDGNDADALRRDPMFKLVLDRLPAGEELCSQSTISRLENLPDRRALLRLGRALVAQYCGSFRSAPKRIVLDIDDTFDRVHGGQQLRLFNAYYDDYGFQPIVVFDAEGRFVTALLRPGKRPSGAEIRSFVRRLIGALRGHWPKVEILLRADSHYACPEVFDWCHLPRLFLWFWQQSQMDFLQDGKVVPERVEGLNTEDARAIKAAVTIPVLCTGGFHSADVIRHAIQDGAFDGVTMARTLLANPDLPKVFAEGRNKAERPCTYCNRCLLEVLDNPLGCYEPQRYNSHQEMIADIMSIFENERSYSKAAELGVAS